jgi:hypothetical protein
VTGAWEKPPPWPWPGCQFPERPPASPSPGRSDEENEGAGGDAIHGHPTADVSILLPACGGPGRPPAPASGRPSRLVGNPVPKALMLFRATELARVASTTPGNKDRRGVNTRRRGTSSLLALSAGPAPRTAEPPTGADTDGLSPGLAQGNDAMTEGKGTEVAAWEAAGTNAGGCCAAEVGVGGRGTCAALRSGAVANSGGAMMGPEAGARRRVGVDMRDGVGASTAAPTSVRVPSVPPPEWCVRTRRRVTDSPPSGPTLGGKPTSSPAEPSPAPPYLLCLICC